MAPRVPGGVSDGRWHAVQVQYYNKVGRAPPPYFPLDPAALPSEDLYPRKCQKCWWGSPLGNERLWGSVRARPGAVLGGTHPREPQGGGGDRTRGHAAPGEGHGNSHSL